MEWRGPLPPPAVLRGYDGLVANGAERVMTQFEVEAAHRRRLEDRALAEEIRSSKVSQRLAAAFCFGCLAVVVFCVTQGAYTVANVVGGGTLIAVTVAFLKNAYGKSSE